MNFKYLLLATLFLFLGGCGYAPSSSNRPIDHSSKCDTKFDLSHTVPCQVNARASNIVATFYRCGDEGLDSQVVVITPKARFLSVDNGATFECDTEADCPVGSVSDTFSFCAAPQSL